MDREQFFLSHISRKHNFPLQIYQLAIYLRNNYILNNLHPDSIFISFVWKTEIPTDLTINGRTIRLDMPYMAILIPGDTVSLSPQTPREETFFRYNCPVEYIKFFNFESCFFQITPRMENLRSELTRLQDTLSAPGNADRIDMLALQMAHEATLNKLDNRHQPTQTLPDERIFKVARKIEMYFDTEFDIDKEIRLAGLGRRTFYREWNKFFVDTPKKYLLDLRFNKAKQLLIYTKKSITEISELCGFANTAYFIHSFRENLGLTPGIFRKKNRKNPF